MTPTITWTIVLAIILFTLAIRFRWKLHFERISRTQQLRERFAATRRAAVQLLESGQVEPESSTFLLLYVVSSRLVRRSANYRTYAKDIVLSMGKSEFRSESPMIAILQEEMHSWTPDVRETWSAFIDNMIFMVTTSMWEIRFALFLEKRFGISAYLRVIGKVAEWLSRQFNRDGRLPIGIDVLRTSRRTEEWANEASMAA